MMLLDVDAILFDSDGVLVDSHEMVEAAWRLMAARFDLPIDTLLAEMAGVRAVDTLSKYLAGARLDEAIAMLDEVEIETASGTMPLPGAIGLVESLLAGSFAFVTSASTALAEARWLGAGIPLPVERVTADLVTQGKPDPEPFLQGAKLLGVDPTQCVVFEDSPSGGLAGRAAGAHVIAVGQTPWPFEPFARVGDLGAVSAQRVDGRLRLEL